MAIRLAMIPRRLRSYLQGCGAFVVLAWAVASELRAVPFQMTYVGRMTAKDGKPVEGPVELEVSFYRSASGGEEIVPTLSFSNVALKDGVFQVALDLAPADWHRVFDERSGPAYIAIHDVTHQKTYPRQMFGTVPYAFKVPVDGNTVTYDAYGRLTVSPVSGGNQYVKLDSSAKLPAVDGSQLTGVVASSVGGKTAAAVGSAVDAVAQASASTGNGTLVRRDANGGFTAGRIAVDTTVGSAPGLVVTGASGQAADLQEWRANGGALLAAIDPTGMLKLGSGAFYVGLKAPAGMTANAVYTLPDAPVNGKFLTTDAAGKLSWATPAGGGGGGSVAASDVTGLTTGSIPFATASGLGEDNGNFFWDATNKRLGLGTASPFADVTLGGSTDRILAMERTTVAGGTGSHLTLQAGGAKSGVADKDGGTLVLSAGIATGTGGSSIQLKTATPQGGSAATDNAPTTKVTILGNGNVGIGVPNPASTLYVNGSQSINGPLTVLGTGMVTNKVKFNDATNTFSVSLRAPVNLSADVSWILPESDGTSGQVLTTGGNGQLSWSDAPSSTTDITLSGAAARYIQQSRSPTANTAGAGVSIIAGGAATGATDKNGGPLVLSSGMATGSGSSNIQFQTAGGGSAGTSDQAPTTKMTILGNGNVGIGTPTPSELLQVRDDQNGTTTAKVTNLSAGASAATMIVAEAADASAYIAAFPLAYGGAAALAGRGVVGSSVSTAAGLTVRAGSGDIRFNTGGFDRVILDNSGKLGIGTASPTTLLDVRSTSAHAYASVGSDCTGCKEGLTLSGDDNSAYLTLSNSTASPARTLTLMNLGGDIKFIPNGGSLGATMTLSSAGNVGIGTASPSAMLEVQGDSNVGADWNFSQFRITGSSNPNNRVVLGYDTTSDLGVIQIGTAGGAWRDFSMNPFGGNIGIGTKAPVAKLDVTGTNDIIQVRVKANATQSGSIQEWQDGSGNPISMVDKLGRLRSQNVIIGSGGNSAISGGSGNGGVINLQDSVSESFSLTTRTGTTADAFVLNAQTSGSPNILQLQKAGAPLVTVSDSGDVGIGETAPNGKLHLGFPGPLWTSNGWTKALRIDKNGAIELGGTDAKKFGIGAVGGNMFMFETTAEDNSAAATPLMVMGGGNVTIGNWIPRSTLTLKGAASTPTLTAGVGGILEFTDGLTDLVITTDGNDPFTTSFQHRNTFVDGAYYPIALNPLGGNVGVGTDKPSNTLHVVGSLCVKGVAGNCSGNAAGTIYATTTAITGADLAEHMPVEGERLAPGDVVAAQASASDGKAGVFVKTRVAHQANAVGVVSTKPGVALGAETKNSRPVALAGRVPVNVTLEGGPIAVGDHLVASSTPGKAMKVKDAAAGGVIGIALSAYDGLPSAARKHHDGIAHEAGHQVMMLVQPMAVTREAIAAKDRQIAALRSDFAAKEREIAAQRVEIQKLDEALRRIKEALCTANPDLAPCRP